MLQGRIWDRGTGKAGEWEALTQGTQGKRHKNLSPYLLRIFPPFLGLELRSKISMGPIGGLVEF